MNRLQQDAAETMAWHERQARHKQGYGPRPSQPIGECWRPTITEQERMEREQQIEAGELEF